MKYLSVAFVLLFASTAFTQTHPSTRPALKLIPTPKHIEMKEGRFTFKPDTTIALNAPSPESQFSAQQLIDEVQQDLNLALHVASPGPITLKIDQREIETPASYSLSISADKIDLIGSDETGLFYGVQTLKQLIRANSADNSIPCCRIVDVPALQYRIWQDDISRGPIPTMDFLKREVRTLSEYKYNAMTLYTEHVFKLQKHPDIAPDDGITAEQVKELSDYAKQYHIELIGNFQSFGHMAHILSLPAYKDLGDNGWNISPAKEETYKFLADVYSEIAPAYESKLFDINCDEVRLGNEGASKEMVAKLGLAQVYAQHINRICELLRPYGKTAMMWGDIAEQHQDIVPKLPKDLIVLSWGYSPKESFEDSIAPYVKIGLRFMVCPGVSCWQQIFPNMRVATINISNYVRDGARHGAIGMINTTWDDDGEDFFSDCWYPLIWGAEVGWNPVLPQQGENSNELREQRLDGFDAAFAAIFYGAKDDAISQSLWKLSKLRDNPASGDLADRAFWRDLPREAADSDRLTKDAAQIADDFRAEKSAARFNADTLDYAIFACQRVAFMGREQTMSLDEKLAELDHLKQEYARLWHLESRDWWLDKILAKYDDQAERFKHPATQPSTTQENH